MRNRQLIALAVGVALFVYLIYETGPESLAANLELIGPKLVFIVALERIVDLFNTVGWWFTFSPNLRRGTFSTLYLVRLAGTALNEMTPAASSRRRAGEGDASTGRICRRPRRPLAF